MISSKGGFLDRLYFSNAFRVGGSFEWKNSPLSSWHAPAAAVVAYLLAVFLLIQHMKGRKAYSVPDWLVAWHNRLLCVGSLVMFIGCGLEMVARYEAEQGETEWFFCNPISAGRTPAGGYLYFWSYVYYLSK